MVVKVGLYLAREGREPSVGTSLGKGGHSGGKFARQKGKLRIVEEGSQPDLVATVAQKKVATFEKEELGVCQEVEKDEIGNQIGQTPYLQLLLEGGALLSGLP